ncbi:MAG: DUF2779 domain-containing protein [Elusimicrobiota bacterium]|jgi:hypothetical protein|nr:DUF2779 domain-containing protein [Elusimicrobiota bacterium]
MNYLRCPVLGWASKNNLLAKEKSLSSEFFAFEIRKLREIFHSLFSAAISARKSSFEKSIIYTKELLQNPDVKAICDAVFIANGFVANVDVLYKISNNEYSLFETRASSKHKSKHICDVAFTTMVLSKCDICVKEIEISHLSHSYRLGMDASKMFISTKCFEKVETKKNEFLKLASKIYKEMSSCRKPKALLKKNCRNCNLFGNCIGKGVKNHIFNLPRLGTKKLEELIDMGITSVDKIPQNYELTDMQKIVRECTIEGKPFVSENLKLELQKFKKPFYYLDFESITTALPLYKNVAPHTSLLTQFSIDKTDENGNILNHFEYIADYAKDCRKKIAENLIKCLANEGSIVTYASFEKIAILKLAANFAKLSKNLNKIADRIVDLELIIRNNYYDAMFCGRTSIKKILPVLVPSMSYSDLKIKEGKDATAAFAFMAMGFYSNTKIYQTKKNLLSYCAQDTLAMIKIHQFLLKII